MQRLHHGFPYWPNWTFLLESLRPKSPDPNGNGPQYCSHITGSAFSLEKSKTKNCLQATSLASSISANISLIHRMLICHLRAHTFTCTAQVLFCLHCFVPVEYWAGTDRPYSPLSWCTLDISAFFCFSLHFK